MASRAAVVMSAGLLGVCIGLAVARGSLWWLVLAVVVTGILAVIWRHPQVPSGRRIAVVGAAALLPAATVGGASYIDPVSGAVNSVIVSMMTAGGLLALCVWRAARALAHAELVRGCELARALEAERETAIMAALVHERSVMAGEIHDRLGHRLSLATVRLGRLWQDPELTPYQRATTMEIRDELAGITDDIGETVALLEVGERVSTGARDPEQVVEAARAAGQKISTDLTALDDANELARDALSRVLEEAIANAARHAPSAAVEVRARALDDSIVMTITNPRGGHPAPTVNGTHTGLRRLRDRVRHLGGTLEYSHDDEFTLTVRLPLVPRLHPVRTHDA